jgi:nitrile hydratase accessory protein
MSFAADAPTFREPWQAEAFALAVKLHEQGVFTWNEWAETLADEIQRAQAKGDPDLGDTYYHHWLAALERLVKAKGLVTGTEIEQRHDAWDRAVRATPHGQPIELKR